MPKNEYVPLFETRQVKGRILFRSVAASIFLAICFVFIYRVKFLPAEVRAERLSWIGLFLSEIWFSFYWFLTAVCRWNSVHRLPYIHRLSQRFGKELPGVDVFVCTADASIEPPCMVVNTVLSVMAYDYPPQKLSIYLSDDGGSELTFYAMVEAAELSKTWLPFCNKFKVEPRSPEAYFRTASEPVDVKEWGLVKKQYEDMRMRIEATTKMNRIPDHIRKQHKGFREWDLGSSKHDHQTILQILIDGRDSNAVDVEGNPLPTLVYLAREKRPQYDHHFKAGAMNVLIRVSSKISNGPIILNVDCDMYSNNSESIKYALCIFMDEEKGDEVAFVQFPQNFDNLTRNDSYGSSFRVAQKLEFQGLDANGGPCYIGTGCFHRREALCGKKYDRNYKVDWKKLNHIKVEESAGLLEETCKVLASCSFEHETAWGKEMGLVYGFPVEDVVTGLSIQCRGWKSMYLDPERIGFLGVAPITLLQSLVQHKRWSEGHLQIFLSKYCSLLYGYKKIPLKLRLAYCPYNLWAANCLATLYYVVVPCLCLLKGISLFPRISRLWALPFAYVAFSHRAYSLGEFVWCGGTFRGWCNDQRMSLFKRTTSYFFAFCETIFKLLGYSQPAFVVTAKIADEDISERYHRELIEFGAASPKFDILATLAALNLFGSFGAIKNVILDSKIIDQFGLQILLCLVLVTINLPVYQALFFREDNGKMPTSVTYKSIILALLACTVAMY
ncbi:Cellulose synthase-like protein E1 [Hibiscus syriacus]|uniref:Cellulose synthase-like protein E1 n=1 Tax=Hibiscus syriacus TaxID=106335 RepID=A0A6A3BZX9_HIBSY|nr:cellulose synthase-like protein E1 [Hibiscus syriacus]KAE8722256.1 Cellulose synthase-like protein E1 [Hibiscus syriacus]